MTQNQSISTGLHGVLRHDVQKGRNKMNKVEQKSKTSGQPNVFIGKKDLGRKLKRRNPIQ